MSISTSQLNSLYNNFNQSCLCFFIHGAQSLQSATADLASIYSVVYTAKFHLYLSELLCSLQGCERQTRVRIYIHIHFTCHFHTLMICDLAVTDQRVHSLWWGCGSGGHNIFDPGWHAASMSNSIFIIHHLLKQSLVTGVHWCNGDVTNSTKLSTVVEMFILQTEEIPHKTPTGTACCIHTILLMIYFTRQHSQAHSTNMLYVDSVYTTVLVLQEILYVTITQPLWY